MMDDSSRIERDRTEADRLAAALAHRNAPATTQKYLGTVYDGGSMGASVPAWFLTNPTQITGQECEGCSGTPTVDPDTTVPVLVVGTTAPSVGDMLVARMIGGIWVAQRGSGANKNCCLMPCGNCSLPMKDLQLVYGGTTYTLAFNGGVWSVPVIAGCEYQFFCSGGGPCFQTVCPPGSGFSRLCSSCNPVIGVNQITGGDFCYALVSFTCNPLEIVFENLLLSVDSPGGNLVTISDPNPVASPPGLMCQLFTWCPPCVGVDVTVSVYASEGGTLLDSDTSSTGSAYLSWPGQQGDAYVVVSGENYQTYSATLNLKCGGVTPIALTPNFNLTCAYVNTIIGNGTISLAWTTATPPNTGVLPVPCWYGIMPGVPDATNPSSNDILEVWVWCQNGTYNFTARNTLNPSGRQSTRTWTNIQMVTYACSPVNLYITEAVTLGSGWQSFATTGT